MQLLRLLTPLPLLVAAASPAFAVDEYPDPAPPRGDERAALFAWFDGLRIADVDTLATARTVAVTYYAGTEPAFVTAVDGDTTHVLTAGLLRLAAAPPAEDAPAWSVVTVKPLDFEPAARAYLDEVVALKTDETMWPAGDGGSLSHRARLIVLARVSAARSLDDLAEALLAEASTLPGCVDWFGAATGLSLRERVDSDLEHAFSVRTFARPTPSDLEAWRASYVEFARRFPDARRAADARHNAAVVARMIDEAPSVPTDEELSELEGDALARGLVRRLRTMAHFTFSINGGPSSVFSEEMGGEPSVADRLLALGDVAIPALIEACDDDTLTGLGFTGRSDWHPGVLTVATCAGNVLTKLVPEVGHTTAAQKVWWLRRTAPADVIARLERIEAGGDDALVAARELADTHAETAFWPIVMGWNSHHEDLADVSASNVWIELLGTLDDPRVARELDRRARWGGRLTQRVAAIRALDRHDPALALAHAAGTAFRLHDESHATPSRSESRLSGLVQVESAAAGRLADFLAARGRADALLRRFERTWPHVRDLTVRAVVGAAKAVTIEAGAARDVVLRGLADRTAFEDRQAIARSGVPAGARVCDGAAQAMATLDPVRYAFDPTADEAARDAAIEQISAKLRAAAPGR